MSNNEAGFSVIEIMVAVGIFMATIAGVAVSAYRYMSMNTTMEQKQIALTVAQETLEALRAVDPVSMPSTGSTSANVVKGNRTYVATTQYCLNTSYCTTTERHLTIAVTYRGAPMVTLSTVYASLR